MPSTPSSPVSHAKNIRQGEGSVIHKPEGDSDPSKHNLLRKEECVAWLPDLGTLMGRNEELTGRRGDTPPPGTHGGVTMPAASKGCGALRRG